MMLIFLLSSNGFLVDQVLSYQQGGWLCTAQGEGNPFLRVSEGS